MPLAPLRRDFAVSLVVLGLWVVPITEGAFNAAPGAHWPTFIRDVGSVSCLFRSRPERFSYYRLQVQRGDGAWTDLDESVYFPMHPFGHRSRFDRFMDRWGARDLRARDDLVRWIAARDRELRPDDPPITAVRFLHGIQDIRPDLPPPRGHWQKPALDPRRGKLDSIHPVGGEGHRP